MACSRICMPSTTKLSSQFLLSGNPLQIFTLLKILKGFAKATPGPSGFLGISGLFYGEIYKFEISTQSFKKYQPDGIFERTGLFFPTRLQSSKYGRSVGVVVSTISMEEISPDTLAGLLTIGEGDDIAYYRLKVLSCRHNELSFITFHRGYRFRVIPVQ